MAEEEWQQRQTVKVSIFLRSVTTLFPQILSVSPACLISCFHLKVIRVLSLILPLSCYLRMKAAGKSLFDAEAAAANL